ncbi:MAG: SIS domain-containing protein, partial [Verrucomicrobiota bacterium]|nr:SIS domain-containing protein [Verrucomicrobiota bacterium]
MAYLDRARGLIDKIAAQELLIEEVAEWFAQTILSGRVVHLFGSGHSRIMV